MSTPTFGISAQGTLLELSPDPNWPDYNPQGGSLDFQPVAEQMNIKSPAMTRKEIETTTHNQQDERIIPGIRRKGGMTMNINFLPFDGTHDHITGLQHYWDTGERVIARETYPDGSGLIFSGYITNFAPTANVDDRLQADVTIKPTGSHKWFTP